MLFNINFNLSEGRRYILRFKTFLVILGLSFMMSSRVNAQEIEDIGEPISILEIVKNNLFDKKIEKVLNKSEVKASQIETEVWGIGDNGSVILDISPKELKKENIKNNDLVLVTIGSNHYILPIEYKDNFEIVWGRSYISDTTKKKHIKINRKNQNFAEMEGYSDSNIGDTVRIGLLDSNGYSMVRSKVTKKNKVKAANFRNTVIGNMDSEVVYRGHSPVDPKYNSVQCKSAAILSRENNIVTMINMNQDLDVVEDDVLNSDETSSYYKELLEDGYVSGVELNGHNSFSKSFKKGMKKHIKFILNHESPYYIHCRMGKDRTGFMVALLGALEGATYEEIGEDYAESFRNYFGADKGSWMDYYNITDGTNTFLSMMNPGVGVNEFIKNPKLIQESAEMYLLDLGFDEVDIDILRGKLEDKNFDVE